MEKRRGLWRREEVYGDEDSSIEKWRDLWRRGLVYRRGEVYGEEEERSMKKGSGLWRRRREVYAATILEVRKRFPVPAKKDRQNSLSQKRSFLSLYVFIIV